MIKIAIITPVWQRRSVTKIMLKGLNRLIKYRTDSFEVKPFFAVSEYYDEKLIQQSGFEYIYAENNPLGAKKNKLLNHVVRTYDFDYVMELNSDNVVSNEILDIYEPLMLEKVPLFCPDNVAFVDVNTGKTASWHTDFITGAARCMSRKAVEACSSKLIKMRVAMASPDESYQGRKWMPVSIANKWISEGLAKDLFKEETHCWTDSFNCGMDTDNTMRLKSLNIHNTLVKVPFGTVVDIKSETNIHSISEFKQLDLTPSQLLKEIPEKKSIITLINVNRQPR